jgi:hypothetical protein
VSTTYICVLEHFALYELHLRGRSVDYTYSPYNYVGGLSASSNPIINPGRTIPRWVDLNMKSLNNSTSAVTTGRLPALKGRVVLHFFYQLLIWQSTCFWLVFTQAHHLGPCLVSQRLWVLYDCFRNPQTLPQYAQTTVTRNCVTELMTASIVDSYAWSFIRPKDGISTD